jgi:hypothetical protein
MTNTMNRLQAYVHQVDVWLERHDIGAWRSTPLSAQINKAVEADHAKALEMNANGDASRAAFLGTTDPGTQSSKTPTGANPARRARGIAAIHAFADHLAAHPAIAMPTSITAYAHTNIDTDVHAFAHVTGAPVRYSPHGDGSHIISARTTITDSADMTIDLVSLTRVSD